VAIGPTVYATIYLRAPNLDDCVNSAAELQLNCASARSTGQIMRCCLDGRSHWNNHRAVLLLRACNCKVLQDRYAAVLKGIESPATKPSCPSNGTLLGVQD